MQTEPCYREKSTKRVVAYPVGYSKEELKELLERHPDWYLSTVTFGDERGVDFGGNVWRR